MKIYKNSLGIVCVEPDEGYLLKKGDFKTSLSMYNHCRLKHPSKKLSVITCNVII